MMRKLVILMFVANTLALNAQSKKLLKNEAKSIELNKSRETLIKRRKGVTLQKQRRVVEQNRIIDFNFHNNTANSQVYIKIPENGRYGVEINGQYIDTYTGKFRFFDVESGKNWISIFRDGYLIYKVPVNVYKNNILLLEFDTNSGLYFISERPIINRRNPYQSEYHRNNIDSRWENNVRGKWDRDHEKTKYKIKGMTYYEFTQFLTNMTNNATFDDDKIKFLNMTKRAYFTCNQISQILNELSFEDNKLKMAKKLYNKCLDKNNYHQIINCFTYSSDKSKLVKFISTQN